MAAMDTGQGVRARRARWRWALPLAAVLVLVAAGATAYFMARKAPGRDPVEFLPASTRAAVGFDTRVSAPAALRLVKTWSPSDVRRLTERATEMAQKVVDWSGFDLDIKKDVRPWYGGEVVVASLARKEARPLAPDTIVLVARTTSMRRARASLDKAVRTFAREAEWTRRADSRDGDTVITWADAPGREHIAYAVKDDCLVVGRYAALVAECLRAAKQPSQRLTGVARFRDTAGKMDKEGGAWAYLDVGAAARAGRSLLPLVTKANWASAVRDYLRRSAEGGRTPAAGEDDDFGVLAIGMAPEPNGVRLRGLYRGAGKSNARPAVPARVGQFVPREAAAYLLLRNPGERWFKLVAPHPLEAMAASGARQPDLASTMAQAVMEKLLPPPATWFGFTKPPTELLVVLLPRGRGAAPALGVAAPADQIATPPQGLLAALSRQTTSAIVGDLEILATDARAVKQCEAAMKSSRARLSPAPAEDARFEAWVKPAALNDRFDQVKEIRVQGREIEGGGEGELSIVVPPRYLLGG